MLIEIPDVLSSGEVERIRGALAGMTFVDGRASAGAQASAVKNNEEIQPCNEVMGLAKLIGEGLARHQTFNHFALPRKIMVPIFSRYKDGMNYGSHSDVSVMQIGNPERAIRTDLSITVFLSDPESYDGGALVISTHVGEQSFKLAPGSAVVYPSHNLHWVEAVTRGERLAAVSWVQSYIRQDAHRDILYELDDISTRIAERDPDDAHNQVLFNLYHKLMRLWAEV